MSPLLTLLLLLALLIGVGLIARQGFRDGDRFGDAVARARLVRVEHPDGAALLVEIGVDNRNDSAAMVSARVRSASPLMRLLSGDYARRTASLHRRSLTGDTVLGAVSGREDRTWRIPAESARCVRVVTRVDQVEGRTRIFVAVLPVPAAWRTTAAAPALRTATRAS